MVKPDPDDLISALSKNLKAQNSPVLRFTFKRGGLWQPEFAKAHSRKAKQQIKQKLITQNAKQEDKQYPLLVRYKQNGKQQTLRFNASTKVGKTSSFIESMLGVFRVNFFNRKQQIKQKVVKGISKPNPESKTTQRKLSKKQRNKERKLKRKQITKERKRQAKKVTKITESDTK